MVKTTTIKEILVNIKYKYKNTSKTNKELKLLQQYISKSELFTGEKKKLYKLIKLYKV